MLSDALHERLTHRFVDKRTSVLMRRLRDKEELVAEIGADGTCHCRGSLSSGASTDSASRRTRAATAFTDAPPATPPSRCWPHELGAPRRALSAASDADIVLKPNGRIAWRDSEIARLERGDGPLKPKIQLLCR